MYPDQTGSEKPCTLYPVLQCLPNHVPCTLKTMYYVPQAQHDVPSTLDTMYFHQKVDKKVRLHSFEGTGYGYIVSHYPYQN